MKATKAPKKTRQQLQNEIIELRAQMPFSYHAAAMQIYKAGDQLLAGGALLTLTALGGRELINPVVIRDGLSQATIEALHADILRSYDLTVLFKPSPLEKKK